MLVVVIPLMILAIGILMKICTRLFETMQKKIDGLNNTLQENLVAHPCGQGICPGGPRARKVQKVQ